MNSQLAADLKGKPIYEIAAVIKRNWPNVNFAAKPYLAAMFQLEKVSDYYGADHGRVILGCFLANAAAFKGDVARVVKAELKAQLAK